MPEDELPDMQRADHFHDLFQITVLVSVCANFYILPIPKKSRLMDKDLRIIPFRPIFYRRVTGIGKQIGPYLHRKTVPALSLCQLPELFAGEAGVFGSQFLSGLYDLIPQTFDNVLFHRNMTITDRFYKQIFGDGDFISFCDRRPHGTGHMRIKLLRELLQYAKGGGVLW